VRRLSRRNPKRSGAESKDLLSKDEINAVLLFSASSGVDSDYVDEPIKDSLASLGFRLFQLSQDRCTVCRMAMFDPNSSCRTVSA
jgi:hypothetical protein